MYSLFTTRYAQKRIKKLDAFLKRFLLKEMKILEKNPRAGQQLTGSFSFLRSLHVGFRSAQYRVIYQILEKEKQIVVHLIGPRENLYNRLKRLFK